MPTMPPDLHVLDRVALAVFLLGWLGYGPFIHAFHTRPSITSRMGEVRRAWMFAMLGRDNRITDASLIGNTMHSATFFASTCMIALAALLGMLGKFEATYAVLQGLHVTAKSSQVLIEGKIILLMLVFAHSFLKLSWALRQLNYCLALIGGAPLKPGPAERARLAEVDGAVLSLAIASFNAGIRGYYFALAGLAWFAGPEAFLVVTCGMLAMLLWRQFGSATARAIAAAHPHYRPEPAPWDEAPPGKVAPVAGA
ncbi:MAG: DUF599 domain-containing protein [Janthinobacterium lividum]